MKFHVLRIPRNSYVTAEQVINEGERIDAISHTGAANAWQLLHDGNSESAKDDGRDIEYVRATPAFDLMIAWREQDNSGDEVAGGHIRYCIDAQVGINYRRSSSQMQDLGVPTSVRVAVEGGE